MRIRRSLGLASALLLGLCIARNAGAQANLAEEADKLILQAEQLQQQGDYEGGITAAQRALEIRQQVLGEHPQTAASLLTLAELYRRVGELARAEALYRQALVISEKVLGSNSIEVASALNGLAAVYTMTRSFTKAEPLFKRALTIREQALGPEHLETARVLNGLGILYTNTGEFDKAESCLQRAITISEKQVGRMHPRTASSIGNLANLYNEIGAYDRAERLVLDALAISEAVSGPEHFDTGVRLGNLASIYVKLGEFAKAEPLYLRSAAIIEKVRGANYVETGSTWNNLGELYLAMGRHTEAEVFLRRSLAVYEETLGPQHPYTAYPLSNLANLYRFAGDNARALPLYQRGLAIWQETFGLDHPFTSAALSDLAVLHWAAGNSGKALSLLRRAQAIDTRNSERFLVSGSESRKRAYTQTFAEDVFKRTSFSIAVQGRDSATLGLNSVLQFKGRVVDAVSDSVSRLRQSLLADDRKLFERLAQVANEFSTLTFQGAGSLSPQEYRQKLGQLSSEQDQLEAQLSKRSSEFRRQVIAATDANVRAAIPSDAVLVEWIRYRPFYPTARASSEQWGPPRYAAYVLKRSGEILASDLGPADAVEALIREFRAAASDPERADVKQRAAALSAKVLAPLRSSLQGVRHLLLSPDGELNLVPMAALVDAQGQYLAQRFEITLLTSGRDLLRLTGSDQTASSNVVVIADPDYGPSMRVVAQVAAGSQQRSEELDRAGLTFRSLPGTALEAQAIKTLLRDEPTRVLTGEAASETNLKRVHGPRILHVATHGFFLSDQQVREVTSDAVLGKGITENPLLRSGLALAGANTRRSGFSEDGILTALEASRLDLRGTQLVVLSACETGLGETRTGDGVGGLRRGLLLAGARTQVASLWRVPDLPTKELMVSFYKHLVEGDGRSAALRRAQNEIRSSPGQAHPYYWAGFVTIGDWAALP